MSETEPRLFTLRNLYSSVDMLWIEKEKDRNNTRPKRKLPGDDSGMDILEAVHNSIVYFTQVVFYFQFLDLKNLFLWV